MHTHTHTDRQRIDILLGPALRAAPAKKDDTEDVCIKHKNNEDELESWRETVESVENASNTHSNSVNNMINLENMQEEWNSK